MSNQPQSPRAELTQDAAPRTPKIIAAADLFDGEREIRIEHAGVAYRLRITRRNKLILQK